ncbi:MAG: saccharopine dehydrogenase, partial [Nannocystaceae bacterium]|nr:saccharopine dehydrogenase [Nannocystaceae bacterium]
RRSNALLVYPYGREFRYSECSGTGDGPKGLVRATALAAGVTGLMAGITFEPTRNLIMRKLPSPGEGPNREQREAGSFVLHLIGKGRTETGQPAQIRSRVVGQADPGYGETAKMLGESALCLALDGETLESPGGMGTPAATMGALLLARLREQNMEFVVDDPS